MPTVIWSIILLLAALVLFGVEVFTPGFGLPGISGILLLAADVLITARTLKEAMILGLIAALIILVFLIIGARFISKGRFPKKLILQQGEEDYSPSEDLSGLVGLQGTALTVLRPTGLAELGERRVDVVTRGEFLEPGSGVEVVEVTGSRVVVRACPVPAQNA